MVKAAPFKSPVQAPLITITSPVNVQMIMVSIKVPVIETSPCSADHFVFAAAATMGAEPRPDSLENTPRATPLRIANITVAPAKPPTAAVGVKASVIICIIADGTCSRKIIKNTTVTAIYKTAMAGTILAAAREMDCNPPIVTAATNTVSTTAVYSTGIFVANFVISTIEFT